MGYAFGTFPMGPVAHSMYRLALLPRACADLAELEEQAGPLPISLVAFCGGGAVDLVE
jgi:hypothetical protein